MVMLGDRVLGLLVAIGGAAFAWVAFGLPGTAGQAYGPGFFPSIIGIAMVLAGVALMLRGFARPSTAQNGTPPATGRALVRAAGVIAGVVFYILAADALGFILTSLIVMIALAFLLGARPLIAIPVPVAATLVLSLVFGKLLRVPLPIGPLDVF